MAQQIARIIKGPSDSDLIKSLGERSPRYKKPVQFDFRTDDGETHSELFWIIGLEYGDSSTTTAWIVKAIRVETIGGHFKQLEKYQAQYQSFNRVGIIWQVEG